MYLSQIIDENDDVQEYVEDEEEVESEEVYEMEGYDREEQVDKMIILSIPMGSIKMNFR